jgi:ACS family hexuronate transporter-like MFS transporter
MNRKVWLTVALLFLASFLNYLDRQTLSVLKPTIKSEFQIDDAGYALVVNVFTFCYALAYIGSGWVVDKIGARLSLTIFMIGWSLATIACGLASSFFIFCTFRALLGIMEPGNFPATIRAMTLTAPIERRGFLMSLTGAGGTVGAVAAAPLIAWLASKFSWQTAFIVPGILGIILAVVWASTFREPASKPHSLGSRPQQFTWAELWKQPATWGIILARLISDPVWYYCLFWMPGYFQEQRGLSLQAAGYIGWIPFLVGNVGAISCAAFSDSIARRGVPGSTARRRILIGISCLGPLVALVPHSGNLAVTVGLLSVAALVCLTWLLLLSPLIADTFPAGNVASVWAIAGTFGAAGAMAMNYLLGRITNASETQTMFLVLGLLHPVAAVVLVSLVRNGRKMAAAISSAHSG